MGRARHRAGGSGTRTCSSLVAWAASMPPRLGCPLAAGTGTGGDACGLTAPPGHPYTRRVPARTPVRHCLVTAAVAAGCSRDDSGDDRRRPHRPPHRQSHRQGRLDRRPPPAPSRPSPRPQTARSSPPATSTVGCSPGSSSPPAELAGRPRHRIRLRRTGVRRAGDVARRSLGCPEPDRQYATIVTDGAVIELAADGDVYRYHAGGSAGPFLCATSDHRRSPEPALTRRRR